MMNNFEGWRISHRADPVARVIADRHYSRQKIGAPQFVPPGRCAVFLSDCPTALWVTSWPFVEYVKHAWAGAWVCSAFRKEGEGCASEMIVRAVACTRSVFPQTPDLGMITFVNRKKVRPTIVRGKEIFGWTWLKAGFKSAGETKGGLLAFQLLPQDMPSPSPPIPGAGGQPRASSL